MKNEAPTSIVESAFKTVFSFLTSRSRPNTLTRSELPQERTFLPSPVLVEIFSYLITDYHDIARLRLLSKQFHTEICPNLTSRAGFLKCATNSTANDYIKAITFDIEEGEHDGELIDMTAYASLRPLFDREDLVMESVLITQVVDSWNKELVKGRTIDLSQPQDMNALQSICEKLCETTHCMEFLDLRQKAINLGLFLPETIGSYAGKFHSDYHSLCILTFSCKNDSLVDGEIITLQLHKRVTDGPTSNLIFIPRRCDQNLAIRGFVKDGKIRVPMCMAIDEDHVDYLTSKSLLSLTEIINKHQYNLSEPEGVAIVDGAISQDLHQNLMHSIDEFANSQNIVDYHPHSNNKVRDIIHPALFSYVKGTTSLEQLDEVPPCLFSTSGEMEQHSTIESDATNSDDVNSDAIDSATNNSFDSVMDSDNDGEEVNTGRLMDYWGRKYEVSSKYQWLPTYFDVDLNGNVHICDYVNNLIPRSNYDPLYSALEQLFAQALPQLESVYSYGRTIRPCLRTGYENDDYEESSPEKLEIAPCSLKGQRLQVITKIVDYELSPGDTYEGVWHVEGMSHEEIVATAIYFLHRDNDVTGGNLMFKRAFHKREAQYITSNVPQGRHLLQDQAIESGMVPLGQVETLPNRLLVFPNSHVHKVRKIENASIVKDEEKHVHKSQKIKKTSTVKGKEKGTRRLVVFFLVNPEKRIVSTKEVKPQQLDAGGTMTWEEACEHRLELMKERKYTKQDWNVREIELCEH